MWMIDVDGWSTSCLQNEGLTMLGELKEMWRKSRTCWNKMQTATRRHTVNCVYTHWSTVCIQWNMSPNMTPRGRCDSAHMQSQHLGSRGRQISVNSRPAWSPLTALGQQEPHSETLSQKWREAKKIISCGKAWWHWPIISAIQAVEEDWQV